MAENMDLYFSGIVSVSRTAQITNLETGFNGYIMKEEDGTEEFHPTSFFRELITSKTIEQRYEFNGVPANIAYTLSGTATVNDVYGRQHTVSFDEKVVDGSRGTSILETENNAVVVSPISPHLCRVEVVNKKSEYFANGVKIA